MKKFIFPFILALCMVFLSCKKEGCTNQSALNYDFDADKDDGSCDYSVVTFYAKYGYYSGIPVQQVDVSFDGNDLGSLTAVYGNGPGNCTAQGTLNHKFPDDRNKDWNSTIYLANGAILFGSGTVSTSSYQECIKVNVTN